MNYGKKQPDRRVLILSVGGTIGMRAAADGPLMPDKVLHDLLKWVPELQEYADIQVDVVDNLDSSLMTPKHWLKLAGRIRQAQTNGECGGIVILHGTDTLAYTAAALSFLLLDLSVPVVLTGSQRPLAVIRTDARNNILGAVESALEGPIEIMVYFHHRAFRGNRAVKTAIGDFDAFASPNFPPLGEAGIFWRWRKELFWPETRRPTFGSDLPEALPKAPLTLPWSPGLDFGTLAPALEHQWAVIFEAFGSGNLPMDPSMRDALTRYMDHGGLVFIRSQATYGGVTLDAYGPGKAAKEMGIADSGDMTREATVAKLMTLRGLGLSRDRLLKHMRESLCGELTLG